MYTILTKPNTGSLCDLVPNRRQTIAWINDKAFLWRIYASLDRFMDNL